MVQWLYTWDWERDYTWHHLDTCFAQGHSGYSRTREGEYSISWVFLHVVTEAFQNPVGKFVEFLGICSYFFSTKILRGSPNIKGKQFKKWHHRILQDFYPRRILLLNFNFTDFFRFTIKIFSKEKNLTKNIFTLSPNKEYKNRPH